MVLRLNQRKIRCSRAELLPVPGAFSRTMARARDQRLSDVVTRTPPRRRSQKKKSHLIRACCMRDVGLARDELGRSNYPAWHRSHAPATVVDPDRLRHLNKTLPRPVSRLCIGVHTTRLTRGRDPKFMLRDVFPCRN
jgi:hypothetical protein